jgi:hypothetical protein
VSFERRNWAEEPTSVNFLPLYRSIFEPQRKSLPTSAGFVKQLFGTAIDFAVPIVVLAVCL